MAAGIRAYVADMYYDEDGEEVEESEKSGHLCAYCNHAVLLDESSVLLQGAYAHYDGETIHYNVAVDDDGEPDISPMFMHLDCWDVVGETVLEMSEDVPSVTEATAIIDCDCCQSTIRMGEKLVVADLGKFVENIRLGGTKFDGELNNIVCLPCGITIADLAELETWVDVNQHGECYHCTKTKCWRGGRCQCACHAQ